MKRKRQSSPHSKTFFRRLSLPEVAMDTDRNLLFGVRAPRCDRIGRQQCIGARLLSTSRQDARLAGLLVGRGWIVPADRAHLDYLLARKLHRHGGDPRAGLASIPDDVKRSLAALQDD